MSTGHATALSPSQHRAATKKGPSARVHNSSGAVAHQVAIIKVLHQRFCLVAVFGLGCNLNAAGIGLGHCSDHVRVRIEVVGIVDHKGITKIHKHGRKEASAMKDGPTFRQMMRYLGAKAQV